MKMARTEAQKRADKKSRRKIYDMLSFQVRRELRLRDLLNYAAEKFKTSLAQYATSAIQDKLTHDGITLDILPPDTKFIPEPETKQSKQYMIYLVTSWTASPEEYKQKALGKLPLLEDYVSTFQTLTNAKAYISKKYPKKAHPEDWYFTIYGRYFEAYTKLEAYEKHKQLIESAMNEQDKSMEDDSDGLGGWTFWLDAMNQMHKPDYVEIVKYSEFSK